MIVNGAHWLNNDYEELTLNCDAYNASYTSYYTHEISGTERDRQPVRAYIIWYYFPGNTQGMAMINKMGYEIFVYPSRYDKNS